MSYHEFLADFVIQPKFALSWWANQSLLSMETNMAAICFHVRNKIILRSVLVVNQALVPRVWSETTKTSCSVIVYWIQRTYRNWTSAYICACGVVQVRILHRSSVWRISEIWMKCFLMFFPEVRECLKWRTMLTCTDCGDTFISPEESRTTSGYMDSGPMRTFVSASRWIIMMVKCASSVCLSVCLPVCVL